LRWQGAMIDNLLQKIRNKIKLGPMSDHGRFRMSNPAIPARFAQREKARGKNFCRFSGVTH
jgi:hypothetical protein